MTGQTAQMAYSQRIAEALQAANSDVPSDTSCTALPTGYKRRIFFNVTSTSPHVLGLGYEEVDQNGQPVPAPLRCRAFDPATPTVRLPLSPGNRPVVERWELINLNGADHNFHIHQAHFSVLSAAEVADTALLGQLYGRSIMMDSSPLADAPGSCASVDDWRRGTCRRHPAMVQISFALSGDFVYHCHIAEHEDNGMMAVIRVRSAPSDAGSGVVGSLLSALGISESHPRQPLTPRLGGAMCRGTRVTPTFGAAARAVK